MKDNNHYDKCLYLDIFDVGLPNKIATRIDLCFKTTGLLGYINNDEFAKNKIGKINIY